jgi:hypothetical protein
VVGTGVSCTDTDTSFGDSGFADGPGGEAIIIETSGAESVRTAMTRTSSGDANAPCHPIVRTTASGVTSVPMMADRLLLSCLCCKDDQILTVVPCRRIDGSSARHEAEFGIQRGVIDQLGRELIFLVPVECGDGKSHGASIGPVDQYLVVPPQLAQAKEDRGSSLGVQMPQHNCGSHLPGPWTVRPPPSCAWLPRHFDALIRRPPQRLKCTVHSDKWDAKANWFGDLIVVTD